MASRFNLPTRRHLVRSEAEEGDDRSSRLLSRIRSVAAVQETNLRTMPFQIRMTSSFPEDLDNGACLSPCHNLRRISLNDLKLADVATGSYLVLKVAASPVVLASVAFVARDGEGEVERIAVHNHPLFLSLRSGEEAARLIPEGTVVVIKEPHFKQAKDGDYVVRIDTPSNIMFLPPLKLEAVYKDLSSATIDAGRCKFYTQEGNHWYEQRIISRALECYNMATKYSDCPWQVYINKSVIQLKLNQPYEAYVDASTAARKCDGTGATLLRASEAAAECRFFRVAYEYRRRYCLAAKIDVNRDGKLLDYQRCLREMFTGDHSAYKVLLRNLRDVDMKKIPCGDYVGPIKIVDIPGKGRGVVATRDIEAGEVLLFCRPIFSATVSEDSQESRIEFLNRQTFDGGAPTELRTTALSLASSDRLYRYLLSLLYSGSERTREFVSFGDIRDLEFDALPEVPILTPAEVSKICDINHFSYGSSKGHAELHLFMSFFNHSCESCTTGEQSPQYSEMRAARAIRESEEVTVSYIHPGEPLKKRQQLFKAFGFLCDCALCKAQASGS